MGSAGTNFKAWHCIQVRLLGHHCPLRHLFSYPYKTEVFKFVKHRVEKYIFKYEPLYVARAETPQFDERFIGFGMTRNTQVQFWLNKALQAVQS